VVRAAAVPDGWRWVDNKLVYPVTSTNVKERFAAAARLLETIETV